MFVRLKKIGKNEYGYLVESIVEDNKIKQKVIKYLGRCYDTKIVETLTFQEFLDEFYLDMKKLSYFQLLDRLTSWTERIYDIQLKDNNVFKVNQGYFSKTTIEILKDFKPTQNTENDFANMYLEAGFPEEKEIFINLFLAYKRAKISK